MFLPPVEGLLRGVHFDGSDFDAQSFSAKAFVMPLFVPSKYLILNFGTKLRNQDGGNLWSGNMPNLVAQLADVLKVQALPFLHRANTLDGFRKLAASFSADNPHAKQAIAFCLLRSGHFQEAASMLSELIPSLDYKVGWQREIAERAQRLKVELDKSPLSAREKLKNWEQQTSRDLRL